ncbi:hypothetical protein, partial [Bacillus pumilus]|uniref:hypothetical protein n=1 Tax=Bacillus pumilus TaxID=1408 RepID=UPI001C92DCB9
QRKKPTQKTPPLKSSTQTPHQKKPTPSSPTNTPPPTKKHASCFLPSSPLFKYTISTTSFVSNSLYSIPKIPS